MKRQPGHLTHFFTKYSLTIIMMLSTNLLIAQEVVMPEMKMGGENIFLVMMDTMMNRMDNAKVGSSVESDFISQMIPHHEGAIEMASYEIQYGKDFAMVQLAKSILAEQGIEVQQMKLWLKQLNNSPLNTTTDFDQYMDQTMKMMMKTMPENTMLTNIDSAFAMVMIPHHQAAVDMSKVAIKFTKDRRTNAFAKQIISNQQIEIEQMSSFLKK